MKSAVSFSTCICLILQSGKSCLGFSYDDIDIWKGYGTEWIYFPDGEGKPHFVNLSIPEEVLQTRAGTKGNEIEYRLYARDSHMYDYVILDQSAKSVYDEILDKTVSDKLIKVVTHGWMSSANNSVIENIKNAYLRAQDVIVIGVDWSDTAMDFIYPVVATATEDVGMQVGRFLKAFCDLYNVPGERLHLIGHSLGAHVMGIAALTSEMKVGRVTGLDPARPLFEVPMKKEDSLSLDQSDAQFVDVIHTCGGILGVMNPIGHADFYPNSGTPPQPGCGSIFFMFEACSHSRSHFYFTESIESPTAFPACRNEGSTDFSVKNKCDQETYMGDSVSRHAKGQYYLKTNQQYPFGLISSP